MQRLTLESGSAENPHSADALGEYMSCGMKWGAILGAIFGTVISLPFIIIGTLIGVVLGTFGGLIAALVACVWGGRTGIVLGGIVGGFAAFPPLNPINIYYGGDPPRYFWQAILMCMPALIGGASGLCLCLVVRLRPKSETRAHHPVLHPPIATWNTRSRWVARLIILTCLAVSVFYAFASSDYPKHRLSEHLALQELSDELTRQPNTEVVETQRFTFRRSDATLQENGKKEKWRRVSPQAIQKVAAQDDPTLSDLRMFGAISPYYQPEKPQKRK